MSRFRTVDEGLEMAEENECRCGHKHFIDEGVDVACSANYRYLRERANAIRRGYLLMIGDKIVNEPTGLEYDNRPCKCAGFQQLKSQITLPSQAYSVVKSPTNEAKLESVFWHGEESALSRLHHFFRDWP
jgi:hypothetical protein